MPKGICTKGLASGQVFKIKTEKELLYESIYNILTTRKGERVGNPSFGTNLINLLFNPHIEKYWEAIRLEIIREIELQEPRVMVLNIEYIADLDYSKISLYVTFLNLLTKEVDDVAVMELEP